MIPVVNPLTGEIEEAGEPQSLEEVNRQITAFIHGMGTVNKALADKRRELREVSSEFKARRAALIISSGYGEATQRAADADSQLYDGDDSLGVRKDTLEIEVRILHEKGHDYRAAMSSLQTVASNLRAELNAVGAMPG